MENQHQKIKGYRDLSQQEIDLMNRIKAHAEQTQALLGEMLDMRHEQAIAACQGLQQNVDYAQANESIRCLTVAKEHLQTGQMWFVRAVALPNSF